MVTISKNLKSKSLTIENNLKKLFESINYDFIEYAFASGESPNVYHSKKMSWVNIIIMNEPYLDQLQIKGSFLI